MHTYSKDEIKSLPMYMQTYVCTYVCTVYVYTYVRTCACIYMPALGIPKVALDKYKNDLRYFI